MKFRKKPVVVEATPFTGEFHPHVEFYEERYYTSGKQGAVTVNVGDWIIAEQDGSGYYPCAPDVFNATYDEVTA